MDDATERARRRCWDEPKRPFFDIEDRRDAPEADVGRGNGRVELKEGVEKIEEGRS